MKGLHFKYRLGLYIFIIAGLIIGSYLLIMMITIVTGDRYKGIAYGVLSTPILLALIVSIIISRALFQHAFIVIICALFLLMAIAALAFLVYNAGLFKSEEDIYGFWQVVKLSAVSIIAVSEGFYQCKNLITKKWK